MRTRHCAGLILALIGLVRVADVSASQVSVGEKTAVIADSFARVEDWFGRPTISVYYFSSPLSDEQKSALASKRSLRDKDFETMAGGHYPVFNLLLFFDKGTATCSGDKLVSYTAVFEQNPSFAFGSTEQGPINWAITRTSQQSLLSIGITHLDCSFAPGSPVDIGLSYEWLAEGEKWSSLYPSGVGHLPFRWEIEAKTIIQQDFR